MEIAQFFGFVFLGFLCVLIPQQVFATTPDIENPGVIMKICADDPAYISNLEDHMYDTPLDWFLYWCPEEYDGYSATTRFSVLIHAPAWNTDPDKIDTIGNTPDSPISIYTNEARVQLVGSDDFGAPCTGFSELGPDTGLFQGNVLMTGFPFDYDGDGIEDTLPFSDCGSGSAFGEVESAAFLETEKTGGITVAWEATEDLTLVKSANYGFREGQVSFDKQVYDLDDKVTIVMSDLDYMLYDAWEFPWIVKVRSDSDLAGIEVRVWWVEDTTYATPFFLQGDFYGDLSLTDIDESQFDSRLRVAPGDKIYVEFDDYSLPSPYGDGDFITVNDSASVVFSKDSVSGILLNEVKPTNTQGETINEIGVNDGIQILASVENKTSEPKTVSCILAITNSDGQFEHISWATMNLNSNAITDINQSWSPESQGEYTAKIFIWEQIPNGIPLTDMKETKIIVNG